MDRTFFEKIIAREIPATIEYEDDQVIAIRDISPSAAVHLLVIPKKPIPTVNDLSPEDAPLLGHVYIVAAQLAQQFNVSESGYRIVTNVNAHGGQTVYHLHFHLLGGQPLGRMNTEAAHAEPTPSTAYRLGVAIGAIVREGGILVLAALGLAIFFNAMNPRAITWMKKDFEHVEAADSDLAKYLSPAENTSTETGESEPATPSALAPKTSAESSAPVEGAAAPGSQPSSAVPVAPAPSAPAAASAPASFTPEPGLIREISYTAFTAFLKQPHYLIDARRPEAYAEGYIADAVNIYGGEVQGNIPMILEMVPRDRVIMIYCDGGDECELSHHVADVLKQFGYGPMFVYKGGWNEWLAKKKKK